MANQGNNKDIFKDGFYMNSDLGKSENEKTGNQNEDMESENRDIISNDKDVVSQDEIVKEREDNKSKDFLANVNRQTNESFQEEKFIKQKTDYKKWIIQFVVIAIAAVAVFLFLNQKTEVIDFTHMAYQDVAAWAGDKDVVITVDRDYSSEVDVDHVISQSIQPGEKVKKDTNIIVVVSEGLDPYEKINLPDFDSSWSRTSISRWLEQNGIENFTFRNEESTEIAGNYLISYRLIGATEEDFMRSSEIEFTISHIDEARTVTVQSFLNRSLAEVDIWARNNGVNYTYTYDYSSIYDRDKIMFQSVAYEEEMDIDETINFIISKGEETEAVIMENFLNRTILEADIWAKNNGIKYTYSYDFSSIYDRDMIMYQSVASGEEMDIDETVNFIISRGEETETVIMENFLNRTILEADIWAKNNSVNYTCTYDFSSVYERDKIMSQSAAGGEEIEAGQTISFTLSKGEEITVPSFTEVNVNEAAVYMQESGITVEVVELYKEGTNVGDFISQSIPAGTKVEEDASITVHYSLGDTLTVPNYTNQLKVDFEEWVREQNEMGANITLRVYEDYNESIEYGRIISQNIFNDNVGLSTNIELLVSLGDSYRVINFSGYSRSQIQSIAEREGLTIVFEQVEDTGLPSGRFISQEPASGEIISKKDFIKIQVAE